MDACTPWDMDGMIWAELKPGDEIVIDAGAGDPVRRTRRTAIVLNVQGASALMTDGTRLCCRDTGRFRKTGRRDEGWRENVSPEARRLQEAAALRQMELGGAFN